MKQPALTSDALFSLINGFVQKPRVLIERSARNQKATRDQDYQEASFNSVFSENEIDQNESLLEGTDGAIQLVQVEAQAASDVDGGGILFGGGESSVVTTVTESSVGLGVISVVGPGALIGIGGSNVFATDISVGSNNPVPVEEITRPGMDFNEREVTTPGVSITTTAGGNVAGMTTVGAIYSEVDVTSQQVTIENTFVQETTREVIAANAVQITADGSIDLFTRAAEATSAVGDFVFDPAFESLYGRFFGTLGLQASTIELTSNNANIFYLQIGGGTLTTQRVPESTTQFQSISVDYTQAESVELNADNANIEGIVTVTKTLDASARNIGLSIVAGNFVLSEEVIAVNIDEEDPTDVTFETLQIGVVVGAERVELTATSEIDNTTVYAKSFVSSAVSTDVDVFGSGEVTVQSTDTNRDRFEGILPSESVTINTIAGADSNPGSSLLVMSRSGSITTLGGADRATMVNAQGIAQQMNLDLGDGNDTLELFGRYFEQPSSNFVFSGGSNDVYTLTVKDGESVSDVYTISGVETVDIRNSISIDGNNLVYRFLLTNGTYVLQDPVAMVL